MNDCSEKNCKNDTIILDKLAQLSYKDDKSLNNKVLERRARAKFITTALTLGLVNNNPYSPLIKSYWNSYYCNNSITIENGIAHSKHCKNRWCLVCTRIKTATYINAYLPVLKQLPDKQFVTLTVPNVSYDKLGITIDDMQKTFIKLINKNKLRGKFKGIRKLEVTFNPLRISYHPHYHIILSGRDIAENLYNHWLDTYKNASSKAQDIREINDNNDGDLIELFKYATKIIQKDIDKPTGKTVYFEALNNILLVLKNRRTFQPFGIKKPRIDEDYSLELEDRAMEIDLYKWEQEIADWINEDGITLSNYKPAPVIVDLVNKLGKKQV